MPLTIRSEEVSRLAEKLASQRRVSKTEAVRIALANELERLERGGSPSKRGCVPFSTGSMPSPTRA